MRKLSMLLFALMVVVLALAGCAAPPLQHSTSFMVSGSQAEYDAYQTLVEAFQADNPDYGVELRFVPDDADYRRRLAADFSAGTQPDVMLLNYRRIAPFADEGALAPVGPYLANSTAVKEADFYQPAIDAFRYKGDLWCIPQNVSSLAVYYNKALFDAAGLAYPADDWTWDDFVAAAKALTVDKDGDGVTDQFGVGIEPILYRLAPFIWQAGGELVDDPANPTRLALDSPAALQAFQWFVDSAGQRAGRSGCGRRGCTRQREPFPGRHAGHVLQQPAARPHPTHDRELRLGCRAAAPRVATGHRHARRRLLYGRQEQG